MRATIPSEFIFSWESQAVQYPRTGPAGISYFRGDLDDREEYVDCLLYRNDAGQLIGILNYYPQNIGVWEKKGNVNIWVKPTHQHCGVASRLLAEADRRWQIDFEQQRYTPAGLALVRKYLEEVKVA